MPLADAFPKLESDYAQVDKVLRRGVPDRVPAVELFADHDFIRAALGCGPEAIAADRDYADWQRYWLWRIAFQRLAGPEDRAHVLRVVA